MISGFRGGEWFVTGVLMKHIEAPNPAMMFIGRDSDYEVDRLGSGIWLI